MKSNINPALRLAAVSDVATTPRRQLTTFDVLHADLDIADLRHMYGTIAGMLGVNYAMVVAGVTHLLPANRGAR